MKKKAKKSAYNKEIWDAYQKGLRDGYEKAKKEADAERMMDYRIDEIWEHIHKLRVRVDDLEKKEKIFWNVPM